MNSFAVTNDIGTSSKVHLSRVLIVDDHELFRHGLSDLLNSIEGFQVVAEASSCKDALLLAERLHVDLVMLDMYLPDGEGIELTRQLRLLLNPSPRVVILSAMVYDDILVDAILAGAHGYLTKDMPSSEITKALKGVQRGELALLPLTTANLVHLLVQKYKETVAELAIYRQSGIHTSITSQSQVDELNHATATSSATTPIFTPQEAKVFQLLRLGQTNKQIATNLMISPYTVGKHVQNILRKLGVSNRTQAVSYTSFEGGDKY
jgi:DNA-binding NarL/FixJ family response regulator